MADFATERFGPYVVYEQLGIGGMASVHRAEVPGSLGFARSIALKRMLPHVASNEEMVRAFVREARLASHLRHENVAQTYELGKVGDIYFIAMELVEGRNLREILKHCGKTTGPMPVPIALNILNQICDALDYAHNLADETGQPLGIIHRDVTPSNIIVSDGGVVKLIDFGIAKASAAGMQTMSGTIKGKFGYMAPEYIKGSIDARADLFALGVIAHELLTNRPLFAARDDLETLTRVQEMEVKPPSHRNPDVPPEIDDIVMTALSRDPDRRWQQATALRSALTTLTRRLGLQVMNSRVVEWLDSMFEHTDPSRTLVDANMSMEIGTVEISTSAIGLITPVISPPPPPNNVPSHTPNSMTAQRSIPPRNQSIPPEVIMEAELPPRLTPRSSPGIRVDGYTNGTPHIEYSRHGTLVPTGSRLSSPQIPLRQSNPQITPPQASNPQLVPPPSAPPQASNPQLVPPRTTTPSAPPPQASNPQLVPPRTTTPNAPTRPSDPQLVPPRAFTPPSAPPPRSSNPQISNPQIAIGNQSGPIGYQSGPQRPIGYHSGPEIALPQMPNGSQPPGPPSDALTALRQTPIPRAEVPAKRGSRALAVFLILLAAGAAAALVYFVLPLLTSK